MKFLIIKTSSLGDIIQTFPVASYLYAKFPGCQIDWVVEEEFSDLVLANPQVNNVISVKTRKWRRGKEWGAILPFKAELQKEIYDAAFDLQGNTKSALINLFVRTECKVGFGKATVSERPNLFVTKFQFNPPEGMNIRDDYLFVVKSYFSDTAPFDAAPIALQTTPQEKGKIHDILNQPLLKGIRKVMVCPGSAWKNKQINEPQLIEVLTEFRRKNNCAYVFCWGSEAEKQICQNLLNQFSGSVLLEKMSLPALQGLMDKMDFVISMDSLPLHLAGTTSVGTYSFFGPSSANKYCPNGPQHFFNQGVCPYGRTFEKRCPILRTCATGACLRK
jgi:heptosyltransferase-1